MISSSLDASLYALAYVPFKQPLGVIHEWWWLLIVPLAFGIALVYKAMRLHDLGRLWPQTLLMTVQIILGVIALALALTVFVQVILPLLPVQPA